jgi:hypothetical protein
MSNNQQVNQLIAQLLQLTNNSNNSSISLANLATLLTANQTKVDSEVKQASSSKTTRKLSGYNVYMKENTKFQRALVNSEMPNETKTVQARETTKRIAQQWKAMTDAEKAPFISKAKGVAPEQKAESQVKSNPEFKNPWVVFCNEQRAQRGKLKQEVLSAEWANLSQAQKDHYKNKERILPKNAPAIVQVPVVLIPDAQPIIIEDENQDVHLEFEEENEEGNQE